MLIELSEFVILSNLVIPLVLRRYVNNLVMAYRNSWALDTIVGRWTLDSGRWTLDAGLWTLGFGI